MSLRNPKFLSKLKRAEMADEAELFCISASKTVVLARLLVSVNDLLRGLSSSVFRVEQITQNPVVATPCGFDPHHRHQKIDKRRQLLVDFCFSFAFDKNDNPRERIVVFYQSLCGLARQIRCSHDLKRACMSIRALLSIEGEDCNRFPRPLAPLSFIRNWTVLLLSGEGK